jgi:hypothetical protein
MKVAEIAFVAYPVTEIVIADPDSNKITIHKRHPQGH